MFPGVLSVSAIGAEETEDWIRSSQLKKLMDKEMIGQEISHLGIFESHYNSSVGSITR
jgi:hypothetical protein